MPYILAIYTEENMHNIYIGNDITHLALHFILDK